MMVLGGGSGRRAVLFGGILCHSHAVWTSVIYRPMSPQRVSNWKPSPGWWAACSDLGDGRKHLKMGHSGAGAFFLQGL